MSSYPADTDHAPEELALLTSLEAAAGSPKKQLDLVLRELHSARPILTKIRSLYEAWFEEANAATETAELEALEEPREAQTRSQKASRMRPKRRSLRTSMVVANSSEGAQRLPPRVDWALVRKLIRQASNDPEMGLLDQADFLSEIFKSLSSALRDADRPKDGEFLLSIWKCSLQLLIRAVKDIRAASNAQSKELATLEAARPRLEEVEQLQQLVEKANRECAKLQSEISDLLELLQSTDNELADLKSDEQRLLEQLGTLRKKHTALSADIIAVQKRREEAEERVVAVETKVLDNVVDEASSEIQEPSLMPHVIDNHVESAEERKQRERLQSSRRQVIEGLAELYSTYSVLVDQAEASIPPRICAPRQRSLSTQTAPSFLDNNMRAPEPKPRARLRRRSLSRRSLDASAKAVAGAQFSKVVQDYLASKCLDCPRLATWSIDAVENAISAIYSAVFGCKTDQPSLLRIDLTRRSRQLFSEWYEEDGVGAGDQYFSSFLSSLSFNECKSVEANVFLQLCFSLGLQERLVLYNVLVLVVSCVKTSNQGKLLIPMQAATHAIRKVILDEEVACLIEQLQTLKFDMVDSLGDHSLKRHAVVCCGDLLMLVAKAAKSPGFLSSKQERLLSEVNSVLLQ